MNNMEYTWRRIRKAPTFAWVVVITLAIGIGTSTMVLSWVDSVLRNIIPGAGQSESLVAIVPQTRYGYDPRMSFPDARDIQMQSQTLEGVTGADSGLLHFEKDDTTDWVWAQAVMVNFFEVLKVVPFRGSLEFPSTDRDIASAPYVVVSHHYWKSALNGNEGAIGQSIRLNGKLFTIIGISPPEFRGSVGGLSYDLWVPVSMGDYLGITPPLDEDKRGWHWMQVLGRLKQGVELEEAQAEMKVLVDRIHEEHLAASDGSGIALLPLWRAPEGGQEVFLPLLKVLSIVAICVLVLVFANLSGLILARGSSRDMEIGIRLALGGTRMQAMQQGVTELLILTLTGGVLGLVISFWGRKFITFFFPNTYLPTGYQMGFSWWVFGLATCLIVAMSSLLALIPLWQIRRSSIGASMNSGGRGTERGEGGLGFRKALVVGQFSIALILLVGAGLSVKSFMKALRMDLGFNPEGVWVAGIKLDSLGFTAEEAARFYHDLKDRLRSVEGVVSVSFGDHLPLGFEGGSGGNIVVSGYTPIDGESMNAELWRVRSDWFVTLGIPLMSGRGFRDGDDASSALVAIINQEMVERYFKGRDPLGQTVEIWGADRRIVGVVQDHKSRDLGELAENMVYVPQAQLGPINLLCIIRTTGPLSRLGGVLKGVIGEVDPRVSIWYSTALTEYIQASFILPRIAATLLAVISIMALGLAMIGAYAMAEFHVSRRTREMGIRLALGAMPRQIYGLVIRFGFKLSAAGMVIGLVGGFWMARLLSGFLIEVQTWDAMICGISIMVLLGAAFLGFAGPARRAANTNPLEALKADSSSG